VLRGVVAFVVEVCFVDDLRDAPQQGVGEFVAAQDGFEAAVSVVVAEFDPAQVEWCGVGGDFGGVSEEDELGVGVDGRRLSTSWVLLDRAACSADTALARTRSAAKTTSERRFSATRCVRVPQLNGRRVRRAPPGPAAIRARRRRCMASPRSLGSGRTR
jgi:hypothetical protein